MTVNKWLKISGKQNVKSAGINPRKGYAGASSVIRLKPNQPLHLPDSNYSATNSFGSRQSSTTASPPSS